jgi:hypothetical protein
MVGINMLVRGTLPRTKISELGLRAPAGCYHPAGSGR